MLQNRSLWQTALQSIWWWWQTDLCFWEDLTTKIWTFGAMQRIMLAENSLYILGYFFTLYTPTSSNQAVLVTWYKMSPVSLSMSLSCPFSKALPTPNWGHTTLTHWHFPTTPRHLGGSHPCITVLLNHRLNAQVVPEVGYCECGISKAHALLSSRNNGAYCVRPQVSILI